MILRMMVLASLVGGLIHAAEPAGSLPSADEVLQKHIQALGGRAALEKIQSRRGIGTIEIKSMGLTAPFEYRAKAPNQRTTKIEFAGMGSIREGFDGTIGWELDPMGNVREKTGKELERTRRDAEFQRELKMKSLYESLKVTGREKLGDDEAFVLEATAPAGKVDRYYFDVRTGLLRRQDSREETPGGPLDIIIYFEDYRPVNGVLEPFTLRMPQPETMAMVVHFTDVKHNVEVPASAFAKPAK